MNENESESIFLSSIYTKEKLNKYKKILKYYKNHIEKVIDAIEKDLINHSILKTLIDSIETYYKEYKINIDSIEEDDDNTSIEDDEEEDEKDKEEKEEDDEEEDEKDKDDKEENEEEDEEEDDKGKKDNNTSSSLNLNSDSNNDNDSDSDSDSSEDSSSNKKKADILLQSFREGELMFKRNNNSSDIYKNIKTFISNSYVY